MRDQIDKEIGDAVHEFRGLWERADVARHARMPAAQLLELRDVIRIGKKAHVEHEITVRRYAVAEAKAVHLNQDLALFRVGPELLDNQASQLMYVEPRSVDRDIRQFLDGREHFPLLVDA